MNLWIKGLVGGIIVLVLYLLLNLIFVLSGNSNYQSMVDIKFYKNIPTMMGLFAIGIIVGLIISLATG